jgi:hypothetical protein
LQDSEGKYALRILIEKSDIMHRTSDNTIYVRQSAQSIPLKNPEQILSLSYSKGESSYEE